MKFILSISLLILLSCSKEKAGDLGPYYNQFIGTWKSVNASEKVQIKINEKGLISVSHEIDRGSKLKVVNWSLDDTTQYENKTWIGYDFFDRSGFGIDLFLESVNGDSLYSRSIRLNINNNQLNYPYENQIFVRAN